MKRIYFYLAMLIFLATSCTKENQLIPGVKQVSLPIKPLKTSEINEFIKNKIDQDGTFNWTEASDLMVWSAAMHGDSILSIGYGNSADDRMKSTDNKKIKIHLIDEIMQIEKASHPKLTREKAIIHDDDILSFVDIKVTDYKTVVRLRQSQGIRYLEPMGYDFFAYENQEKSASGCSKGGESINSSDYRLISPNCYVSWVYDYHRISSAWSYSTGKGITVGLVDTGVSKDQKLMNSDFNDGYSSGRYIQKYGTYVDSWWPWSTKTDGPYDKCSHGTSMASNISSPRNNDYQPVGVAYNCNLVAYRASSDVVLDGYHEQQGVADAFKALANRSDVKIISMSMGMAWSIGKISDAIKYAYSRGKLIFCAGGTSTSYTNWYGVIFPANMNETVAVTGITDGSGYEECSVCHKGSKIDFTVTMQRAWDDSRTSPTLGFYTGTKQYVGGSSIATSTMAGVAALVWARHTSWNRNQVLQKLKEASDLYPNRNSNFGYGNVDALAAVL